MELTALEADYTVGPELVLSLDTELEDDWRERAATGW
jgi:hypothetical protein